MPGMDAMPMEMGESPGGIDKKLSGNHEQKTRFFIKPNLMQLHSSYVVTDPKGTVLVECGKLLSRGSPRLGKDGKPLRNKKGKIIYESYQIKVFNTINFKKSMHYNPFAYLHSEKDILKLVLSVASNNTSVCFFRFVEHPSTNELAICACIALQSFLFRLRSRRWSFFLNRLHRCSSIRLRRFCHCLRIGLTGSLRLGFALLCSFFLQLKKLYNFRDMSRYEPEIIVVDSN